MSRRVRKRYSDLALKAITEELVQLLDARFSDKFDGGEWIQTLAEKEIVLQSKWVEHNKSFSLIFERPNFTIRISGHIPKV